MIMADIAIINKVDSAQADQIATVRQNISAHAPQADIVLAQSEILAANPQQIKGKRVLVVEDGPTLTHGGMSFGAGTIAAQRYGATEIVEAAQFAVGSIRETFANYPQIKTVLPAMGYGAQQVKDLEETIRRANCDLVLCATPIDLPKLLTIDKPTLRVRYEYQDAPQGPQLEEVLKRRLAI
jgi:predicted GTPase